MMHPLRVSGDANNFQTTVDPGPHEHKWNPLGWCTLAGCDAVNPSTVQAGDVVEVVVAGRVETQHGDRFTMLDDRGTRHTIPADATVRVVRPAPDPAEQEIQALAKTLIKAVPWLAGANVAEIARALHDHNVRVTGEQP